MAEQWDPLPPDALTENDAVCAWRFEQLSKAGYPLTVAALLAQADVDLHLAIKLLNTGCSPEQAFSILI